VSQLKLYIEVQDLKKTSCEWMRQAQEIYSIGDWDLICPFLMAVAELFSNSNPLLKTKVLITSQTYI
jgi:hypothetical protein